MNIEFYGFEKLKYPLKKWYTDYTGIKLFGKRFIGFNIYNNQVVVSLRPNIKTKPDIGIWLYIFFYCICIEIKGAYKT